MTLTKDAITDALRTVFTPAGDDLVTSGALVSVAACDAYAAVRLCVEDADADQRAKLARVADAAVRSAAKDLGHPVESLVIEFVDHAGNVVTTHGQPAGAPTPPATPAAPPAGGADAAGPLPNVAHVIAVGAGKGGVGKSTIAVSLAVGLARSGHRVGLLDGDIYGPSLPTMLGLDALEQTILSGNLQPFMVHGIKAVTMGKLVEPDKPLIWRGPMAHGAFNQLVTRTDWGELDYLVIDLPPGTGDVPLTMAQQLRLTGAVIVCTPQKVAQDDAIRAARMFNQLDIDVLGIVENMSYFIGDPDAHGNTKEYDIFGRGGAEMMAQKLGLPFLGAVPINTALRANADAGRPLASFDPEAAGGPQLPRALEGLTTQLEAQVALAAMQQGAARPSLSIS